MRRVILTLSFVFITLASVGQTVKKTNIKLLKKSDFEKNLNNTKVMLYTLKNTSGMVTEITNFGGKVVSLWVPDRLGNYEDIVLGYSNIDGYLTSKEKYFGALIGRYANRIAEGKFSLEGREYNLAKNNGENHLHGGNVGYDAVIWDSKQIDVQTLELHYVSKNMEEGYPGNLTIRVVYQLTDANELQIEYWATTDATTIVNLTQHSFFNLKGAGNGTINDHLLQINAAYYTPVGKSLIPTGEIATVEDTPFDFQQPIAIGKRLKSKNKQLEYGHGYDHNFVLNQSLNGLNFAAKILDPISGRAIEVYTNEPGIQFYGGNFLDGSVFGKQNKAYKYRSAFCLETQHFPDSPNHPNFPTTQLKPGEEYYSICVYKFLIAN